VPPGLSARIRERSEILPVPLDVAGLAARAGRAPARTGPCRILWNHRWEHDKGPELLFATLAELAAQGLDFELLILGQRYAQEPECFAAGRAGLAERIVHWGFLEDREQYYRALCSADVALSTARHEFQGLAVLEAAACGAVPLVPDDLVYPEIWPSECRYGPGELSAALAERVRSVESWRQRDFRSHCRRFDWEVLMPAWADLFAS